jgi:hypothetical protein
MRRRSAAPSRCLDPGLCRTQAATSASCPPPSTTVRGRGAISGHRQPSPGPRVGGSAGAVAAGGTVGPPALATALPVAGVAVGPFAAADDRPGPGGGLAGPAFAVQLDDDVGAQGGVLLVAADPLVKLCRCPRPRRERMRVEGHEHRVQGRGGRLAGVLAGGGDGPLADRFRVGGGRPRPWRPKALRSDGQLVPSSWAAALTLPSRSARAKAPSASARSARNRQGCQPARC